jgi:hypothetical protein
VSPDGRVTAEARVAFRLGRAVAMLRQLLEDVERGHVSPLLRTRVALFVAEEDARLRRALARAVTTP